MKTRLVESVEVTADRIVAKLIDRLIVNETTMKLMQKELDDIRGQLAESCAWLVPGVGLRFGNVLTHNSDNVDSQIVIISKDVFVNPSATSQ